MTTKQSFKYWDQDPATYADWTEVEQFGKQVHRKDYGDGQIRAVIHRTEDGAADCGVFTDLALMGVAVQGSMHSLPREFGQADGIERAKKHADQVARKLGVGA